MSQERSSAPITGLPSEVLLSIFKLVYAGGLVSPGYDDTIAMTTTPAGDILYEETPLPPVWNEQDDPDSPSLFPYALASVCRTWRAVLSMSPEFWTRVVVHADSPQFSLAFLLSQFEWSRDLFIDVTVTRIAKSEAFTDAPAEERKILGKITNILGPHFHRCKRVRYEATYTASLPWIATAFYGDASELTELEIMALNDNGPPEPWQNTAGDDQATPFRFRTLSTLALDGWNFVHLFRENRQWIDDFVALPMHHRWKTLALSHYRPGGSEPRPTITELWPALERMGNLSLENVDFEAPSFCVLEPTFLDNVSLKDLDSDLTAAILKSVGNLESLQVTGCALDKVLLTNVNCPVLDLEDIDATSTAGMARLLRRWSGDCLSIQDCPGFDDNVLNMLAARNIDSKGRVKRYNAPLFSSLYLNGVCGCSAAGLRRMVEGRTVPNHPRYLDDDGFWEVNDAMIRTIVGRGVVGISISAKDKAWFEEKVEYFSWSIGSEAA
jgi:hypothetical protein